MRSPRSGRGGSTRRWSRSRSLATTGPGCDHADVIVGMGRYRGGVEVDAAQSQVIRSAGTLTPDAVSLVRAMYERATAAIPRTSCGSRWPRRRARSSTPWPRCSTSRALWIADALNPRQRAKAEFAEGDGALIVFKVVIYDEPDLGHRDRPDRGDRRSVLRGDGAAGPGRVPRARSGADTTEQPERLALGPLAAVHAIADAIVDGYLEAADEIGRDLDTIEEHVFSPAITDDSEVIYLLKRENLELRRAVSPLVGHAQRLVEGRMPNIPDDDAHALPRPRRPPPAGQRLRGVLREPAGDHPAGLQRAPGPAAEHRHAQDGRLRRPPGRPHRAWPGSTG